eukprot:2013017-Prymnesium_polylepis.1
MIEVHLVRRTPHLVADIKRRRKRAALFSRLLLEGKHATCARALFTRWLEWVHLRAVSSAPLAFELPLLALRAARPPA